MKEPDTVARVSSDVRHLSARLDFLAGVPADVPDRAVGLRKCADELRELADKLAAQDDSN
jgi:hypothetical protein